MNAIDEKLAEITKLAERLGDVSDATNDLIDHIEAVLTKANVGVRCEVAFTSYGKKLVLMYARNMRSGAFALHVTEAPPCSEVSTLLLECQRQTKVAAAQAIGKLLDEMTLEMKRVIDCKIKWPQDAS